MARPITALFTDRRAAQRAMVDLEAGGFDPAGITLSRRTLRPAFPSLHIRAISPTTGAILGAILLGIVGALVGWAANAATSGPHGSHLLLFAGIPIVGGMVGGLAGGLVFTGVPVENADYLRWSSTEASYILSVKAAGREAVAHLILTRNGGKDLRANRRRLPIPPWRRTTAPQRSRRTAA